MNWIGDLVTQLKRAFSWWIIIAPWEQAVRVRVLPKWLFGSKGGVRQKVLTGGMHSRIPYLDRIFKQSIRMRVSSMPPQTLTTLDGKTLTIQAVLGYEISDIEKLYQKLHDAEDTVRSLASAAIAEYVNTHTSSECTPRLVEQEANKAFSLRKYGISSTKIDVITFAYVRTYRLITGEGYFGKYGDSLETQMEEE